MRKISRRLACVCPVLLVRLADQDQHRRSHFWYGDNDAPRVIGDRSWIPATYTDIISAHYFWTGGLKPGCYDAVAIARAAGFPNAGYEPHPSYRDIVGAVVGIVPLSVFRSIGMINLAGV
jgi:hypothetical protein